MRLTGFLIRVAFAIFLVLITFNPSGWSYFHWVKEGWDENLALKALAGIALVIAFGICGRATYRSIKVTGVVLVALLLAAIAWVIYDFGLLNVKDPGVLQWLVLLAIGLILGIGLSWSIIRRKISGQLDVDDMDTAGGDHDH